MFKINGTPINVTKFPDNTSQVWKLPEWMLVPKQHVLIEWVFSIEGEFMELAQLKDLLDAHRVEASLEMTYLPYGRQDKPVANDLTFALCTFAKLLNSLNFKKVSCLDPHSAIASELINNFVTIEPTKFVEKVIEVVKPDALCYPDKGAVDKYTKMFDHLFFWGDKVRDQKTGYITKYELKSNPTDMSVLIVDDICDGGMTFKLLTKELLRSGAKEVNLYVTHGIFSKGLQTLFGAGINRIFTKDGEAYKFSGGYGDIGYRPIKETE